MTTGVNCRASNGQSSALQPPMVPRHSVSDYNDVESYKAYFALRPVHLCTRTPWERLTTAALPPWETSLASFPVLPKNLVAPNVT
ncbi:hypothetical protein CGMCC3_g10999 [Colletotrichum fructicola]|nr:uncharacterized protein CGMCC3_g10999 [Colletotrichum fructicola]KAE9572960.1 hypothetical protein CGMCC3_g10999 [Colletotrichum fructicola]